MNNDIIKTFTPEQIDFVVELYTNNKYSFDTSIRTLALYANMTDTNAIIETALKNNESKLMAVRDVKTILGCNLVTAKDLVYNYQK